MSHLEKILAYENGELDARATVELFAELVKSGLAWSLQGCYGRQATRLIDAGYIAADGSINAQALERLPC